MWTEVISQNVRKPTHPDAAVRPEKSFLVFSIYFRDQTDDVFMSAEKHSWFLLINKSWFNQSILSLCVVDRAV